jgi:hypothetical protein
VRSRTSVSLLLAGATLAGLALTAEPAHAWRRGFVGGWVGGAVAGAAVVGTAAAIGAAAARPYYYPAPGYVVPPPAPYPYAYPYCAPGYLCR